MGLGISYSAVRVTPSWPEDSSGYVLGRGDGGVEEERAHRNERARNSPGSRQQRPNTSASLTCTSSETLLKTDDRTSSHETVSASFSCQGPWEDIRINQPLVVQNLSSTVSFQRAYWLGDTEREIWHLPHKAFKRERAGKVDGKLTGAWASAGASLFSLDINWNSIVLILLCDLRAAPSFLLNRSYQSILTI